MKYIRQIGELTETFEGTLEEIAEITTDIAVRENGNFDVLYMNGEKMYLSNEKASTCKQNCANKEGSIINNILNDTNIEELIMKGNKVSPLEARFEAELKRICGSAFDGDKYYLTNDDILEAYQDKVSKHLLFERGSGITTSLKALENICSDVVVIAKYNQDKHEEILTRMDLSDKVVFVDSDYDLILNRDTRANFGCLIKIIQEEVSPLNITSLKTKNMRENI